MKALLVTLKLLVFSAFAAHTAVAMEQSFPVKCRFFEAGESLRPPLRDGEMNIQISGDVTLLKLRSGQEELFISVQRGFEKGRRGNDPTVQALEGTYDAQKYILFFRDAVVLQHKDSLGKPLAVMSCQGREVARIADRLSGIESGKTGPMESAMGNAIQTNTVTSNTAAPAAAPAGSVTPNGLPAGMAENLEFLQGQ